MDTVRELCEAALQEIGRLGVGQEMAAEDADVVLRVLKTFADENKAKRLLLYTVAKSTFTMTASLQAHTIGPSGATLTAARPVFLPYAKIIRVGGTIEEDLDIWTRQRWFDENNRTLTSDVPMAVFLEPTFQNATLNFWPIQTTAPTLILGLPQALTTLDDLDDTLSFPPGYEAFWLNGLVKRICRPFRKPLTQDIVDAARESEELVMGLNDEGPSLLSGDDAIIGRGWYDIASDTYR